MRLNMIIQLYIKFAVAWIWLIYWTLKVPVYEYFLNCEVNNCTFLWPPAKKRFWCEAKHMMNIFFDYRRHHQKCIKRNFKMSFKNIHEHSTSDNIYNKKQSSIIELTYLETKSLLDFEHSKYCSVLFTTYSS